MANLIATATGNFTAAATWKQVDSTSELDSEAGTTAVSTSNLDSATFTPGAITVDAIAVKLSARASSPSGTFTVTLWDATASSSTAAVTVNVSDLPPSGLGWVLFKFTGVTLTAGHNYDVRVTCSAAGSQVTLYTNGTANNWSRKLRTTTTQAPAANNHLVICNELTGAGTSNAIIVTMDNTATTTWGPSTVGTQGVVVSGFGTLTFGTSASTAYYFRWRGVFLICGGGTVNVGSSGTRIPTSSTVTFEMDCAANADSRLKIDAGGDIEIWGADKNAWTLLTVDAAATTTGLTVVDTTGWQASDQLGLSPTASLTSESERRTISTVNSGTSVTIDALTNAHKGTGLVICNVLNLTRNVKLRSVSTTLRGNVQVPAAGGTAHIEAVEFVQDTLGSQSIPNTLLALQMTTNAVTVKKCSFNPGTVDQQTSTCIYINGGSVNNFTIDHCVGYRIGLAAYAVQDPTSGTNWTINDTVFIGPNANNIDYCMIRDVGGTFVRNKLLGGQGTVGANAFRIGESVSWSQLNSSNFSDLEVSVHGSIGFLIDTAGTGSVGGALYLKNAKIYRTVGTGIQASLLRRLFLDNCDFFGCAPNGSSQVSCLRYFGACGLTTMYGCTFSGDSSFTQVGAGGPTSSQYGITVDDNNNAFMIRIQLFNCSFGVATGTRVGFVSADLQNHYPMENILQVIANDCTFASSTTFENLTDSHQQEIGDHIDDGGSYLRAQNWGATAGDHRTFLPQGVIKTDSAIFHQLAPSERLTPNTASYKLRSSPKIATVGIGRTRTVSVWVRRSASGDAGGANYGGNQPRLILRRNDSIGVNADTVLATGSIGVGTWEQLTATTPTSAATEDGAMQFYVDCDGTAGWINVDDWGIV